MNSIYRDRFRASSVYGAPAYFHICSWLPVRAIQITVGYFESRASDKYFEQARGID